MGPGKCRISQDVIENLSCVLIYIYIYIYYIYIYTYMYIYICIDCIDYRYMIIQNVRHVRYKVEEILHIIICTT